MCNPIETMYARFDSSDAGPRIVLDDIDLQDFTHQAITDSVEWTDASALTLDTDLFTCGIDSLQASRIRTIIMKEIDLGGHALGQKGEWAHKVVFA
jgi:hypothetical protein